MEEAKNEEIKLEEAEVEVVQEEQKAEVVET